MDSEEVRRLLRVVSGELNFRLLKVLVEEKVAPIELSERLDIDYSTVRTQLMKLKRAGFVDYEVENPYHFYFVRKELPSIFHEFLIFYLTEADKLGARMDSYAGERSDKDRYRSTAGLKNFGEKMFKLLSKGFTPPDVSVRGLRRLAEKSSREREN